MLLYYSYNSLPLPEILLQYSIRTLDVSGNQDARIRVNRKPSATPNQQNQRSTSLASSTSSPSRDKDALIKVSGYDKERETALNSIQGVQSPGMS